MGHIQIINYVKNTSEMLNINLSKQISPKFNWIVHCLMNREININ